MTAASKEERDQQWRTIQPTGIPREPLAIQSTPMSAGERRDSLASFINAHPPAKCIGYTDTELYVSSEVVDTDGNVSTIGEYIPATLSAVRAWLGY